MHELTNVPMLTPPLARVTDTFEGQKISVNSYYNVKLGSLDGHA